ncbi:MAG: carbon storage regulator, partial [Planctomycetota bacterium]
SVRGERVRLGFETPHEVSVHRQEVRKRIEAEVRASRTPDSLLGLANETERANLGCISGCHARDWIGPLESQPQ